MRRGARRASAPTWSPTAATSSCSGSRTASRGSGSREAATAARPRPRRSSWRSSRRSTRRRPTSRGSWSRAPSRAPRSPIGDGAHGAADRPRSLPASRRRASPPGSTLDGLDDARARASWRGVEVGGRRADRRPRRGQPARLPRRLRRLRRRRSPTGELSEGVARLPVLRAPLLPAARRALARRRPPAARAGAAARRRRRRAGRAGGMSEALDRRVAARRQAELVSSLRRLGRPRGAGERRTGPRPRPSRRALRPLRQRDPAPTTATSSTSTERRILCACESCLALRSGDPELRPDRHPGRLARRPRALRRALGARSRIPIGLAFFIARQRRRRGRRPLPEPGRGDRVRARPGRVGGALRPRTRCSTASRPDAEALIVNRMADPPQSRDRADRRVLPAGRADQGELGGDLGGRRAARRRSTASSTSSRRGARP